MLLPLGNQTLPHLGPSDDPGKLCFSDASYKHQESWMG